MPVGEQALSNDQLVEMMGLLKGSDSVELKVTLPAAGARAATTALGMDTLDAQLRAVVFFDTQDLTLNEAGVIVRARRIQGKRDDTVIKLRPVVPEELPEEMRRSPALVTRRRLSSDQIAGPIPARQSAQRVHTLRLQSAIHSS